MEADAIDQSKENIQPLRSGRKARALGVALQAQNDADIQQKLFLEREEYEMSIRLYDGPDPLDLRYKYVLWLEQSFPKHGRESNLVPLLEETISLFKDDKRYTQDVRFVSLIIKFIETQVNALELFQVVFNLGIGTMCSIFYKAWAEELDLCGDIKRADQVYQMGIQNHAQPVDLLHQEHQQFQLSVGRRILSGDIDESNEQPAPEEPTRNVLGKISRKKPGSLRPTLGKAGIVPLCLSNHRTPKSNAPIQVFQESEEDKLFGHGSRPETFPKSESSHKENTLKAGTWNKKYSTGSHKTPVYTPMTPKFKVHEDPDEMTAETPRHLSEVPNALKTRKADTFHCPMAIFEPHDPSVQPMYCKHLVYAGGQEFQLEEIRAAIYNKKIKEKVIQKELAKMSLADQDKSLHLATPICSSAVSLPRYCETGLTPMVPQMLKSGFIDVPPNPLDKGTLPKCVSQLKFSAEASSSGQETLPEKDLKTDFNIFCDEEPMCSALAPEQSPGLTGPQKVAVSFSVFCNDPQPVPRVSECKTPKASAPMLTIIEEDEEVSSMSIPCKSTEPVSTVSEIGKPSETASTVTMESVVNSHITDAKSTDMRVSPSEFRSLKSGRSGCVNNASGPSGSNLKTRPDMDLASLSTSSKSLKSSMSSKSSAKSSKSKLPFSIYCED